MWHESVSSYAQLLENRARGPARYNRIDSVFWSLQRWNVSISRFLTRRCNWPHYSILALINIVGKNDNVTVIKGPKMNHVVDLLDDEKKETLLEESVIVEVPTKDRDSCTSKTRISWRSIVTIVLSLRVLNLWKRLVSKKNWSWKLQLLKSRLSRSQ